MSNNPYTAYAPYQAYDNESPNLRAVLMRYLKHWRWFLLSLALAGAGAYAYLRYKQPIYKVQASLLVKDEKKGLDSEGMLKDLDIFAPKKVVENEVEVLRSYTLMRKVAEQLGLDVQYFQATTMGEREIFNEAPIRLLVEKPNELLYEEDLHIRFTDAGTVEINDQPYPVNQSVRTPYGQLRVFPRRSLRADLEPIVARVTPKEKAVGNYVEALQVEPTGKASTVLMMTLEDAVPAKGEAILNKLIDEYNQAALTDKNKVAANTLAFIEDRLKLISGELTSVEKDVETYKSTQGITDLGTQAQTFLQTVQQNDAQLNQVNIQLSALRDVERYVASAQGGQIVAPATLGLSDPVLLGLVTKVHELELQRDQLARTTSERNPALQSLDSQIKATRASIDANIANNKQVLTSTRSQLVSTNRRLEGMIRTVPRKERDLLNITRQQAIKNNLYTYLLEKREETALSYASTVADSRTIDAARTEPEPVKPVKNLVFVLFGLFGLLLPVGVLAARDAVNDRVVRRSDVEEATRVPILGEVVRSQHKDPLVVVSRNRSVIAEQIRAIRTNLQFLRNDPNGSQVLLFTSSVSGEGKSFISLNLGASLALVGRPTVILEMDLRKPKLHQALGMTNGVGLSNYLIGEATLDEVLQPVPGFETTDYQIITCGPIPPNPAELLASDRLGKLLNELRERFSYIIVDSPPIGLVTDAQLIAPHADATLYVVRHDVTPKTYLRMVDTLYKEQRFHRLNMVLNGVDDGQTYYSYGYYEEEKRSTVKRLLGKH